MSEELDERGVVDRAPPPWGAEITPLTEVCGGQYVLLHEIARGDLSIVYRAKPSGSRDVIAFKVIQPRYMGDETQVRRFRREAELLKRIDHPNVVRLIDHGTIEDGRDFLALEMLSGRTLAEVLGKPTRMSPERTCRIARQVARALRAMHKVGVIHRDLRPENILLIGPEDAERVKLVDLSDAGDVGAPAQRVKDGTGKGASGPKGEASYRAPEQVRKRPPHPSMDVFALGTIMYEMLAGEHPFAKPKAAKLGGHTIRTKAFDAPEVLLGLVADCIERDPDERPRTMDDVLDRIDKALLWMGVVPREVPGDEADEDRRTQLWAAAGGKPPRRGEGGARVVTPEAGPRAPAAPKAAAPAAKGRDASQDELEFDLEDADTEDALPTERRAVPPSSERTRKPWELVTKGDPEPREPPRRSREDDAKARERAQQEEARRAQEEARTRVQEEARRAQEEARTRAQQEEARRAQEEIRRAQEEARRAQEEARRAQEEARRERERGRRDGPATGSVPRVDPEDARERGRRDGPSTGSVPRVDPEDARERGRRDGPSTGSVPRIDLDELRERATRDGPSSGSTPRINPEDLDDGVPTGPRFVVDTVAWTKQQPSAEPPKARKRHVAAEEPDDRSSGEREAPTRGSSSSQRLHREGSAAASRTGTASVRPPTAAHQPVDTLPRWLLPLLVFVLLALAYAVYLVWTQ